MKIAGLEQVSFYWATDYEIATRMWKMTTQIHGESIVLEMEDGTKKFVLMNGTVLNGDQHGTTE